MYIYIYIERERERSRDELISDVLLWIPSYGRAKAGRPARTYIQQPCEDTGCSPEDLPEAMNDKEKWRERVRDIRADGTTWWWWWWWFIYIYIYIYIYIFNMRLYLTTSLYELDVTQYLFLKRRPEETCCHSAFSGNISVKIV